MATSFSNTSTNPEMKILKIGMIGFGSFAQFLAKPMVKQGHVITTTSRSDYSQESIHLGVSFFREMDQFFEADNEVIMICTSILSLSKVVNSLPFHRLKRSTLFVDVLSVKEHPREVLLKALPEEADLLCTHPMFGPESGKDGWKNLAFMFDRIRIRDEARCSSFLQIFKGQGCRMLEMSCKDHDKLAAKSQFLTHTIGRMLDEMDLKPTCIDTKGFQTLIQLKDNTTKDSFDLFSGLFIHNRFAKQELQNLETALRNVKQKLLEREEKEHV